MSQDKIFFDVTGLVAHLRHSSTFSGIQRTVVSIISTLLNSPDASRIYLSYYDILWRRYQTLALSELTIADLLDPSRLASLLGISSAQSRIFPPLRRYQKNKAKYNFHSARFAVSAMLGQESYFRRRNSSIEEWKQYQRKVKQPSEVKRILFDEVATSADRLIILDSSWTVSKSVECFQQAHDRGMQVHVMVHDLIPLVRPDLCSERAPLIFYDWMIKTLQFTTQYIANSEATKADMLDFFTMHNLQRTVVVTPLAQTALSEIESERKDGPLLANFAPNVYPRVRELASASEIVRVLSGTRYVLCVGTQETRKNNWRIVQAWKLLLDTCPPDTVPRLVFAGKSGWMNANFENLLNATGNLGGYVTRIEAPDDRDLDLLYRNCLFTIMPSLYEGWGLPVGESLSYGKTAVTSNSSSLPEVGGDLVRYCDPTSITSIADACRGLLEDPEALPEMERKIAAAKLRSWQEVAQDLLMVR